jgi:hypothetical protein
VLTADRRHVAHGCDRVRGGGFVFATEGLGSVHGDYGEHAISVLAEATLVVVLFTDATRAQRLVHRPAVVNHLVDDPAGPRTIERNAEKPVRGWPVLVRSVHASGKHEWRRANHG